MAMKSHFDFSSILIHAPESWMLCYDSYLSRNSNTDITEERPILVSIWLYLFHDEILNKPIVAAKMKGKPRTHEPPRQQMTPNIPAKLQTRAVMNAHIFLSSFFLALVFRALLVRTIIYSPNKGTCHSSSKTHATTKETPKTSGQYLFY